MISRQPLVSVENGATNNENTERLHGPRSIQSVEYFRVFSSYLLKLPRQGSSVRHMPEHRLDQWGSISSEVHLCVRWLERSQKLRRTGDAFSGYNIKAASGIVTHLRFLQLADNIFDRLDD